MKKLLLALLLLIPISISAYTVKELYFQDFNTNAPFWFFNDLNELKEISNDIDLDMINREPEDWVWLDLREIPSIIVSEMINAKATFSLTVAHNTFRGEDVIVATIYFIYGNSYKFAQIMQFD